MAQFAPFNYGNVLAQGEAIKGARLQNQVAQQQMDPNSPQNVLAQQQARGSKLNNEIKALDFIAKSAPTVTPETYAPWVSKLVSMGIASRGEMPSQYDPEVMKRLYSGASEKLKGFTLGPGQQRFDEAGKLIAENAAIPGDRQGPAAVQEYGFYQKLSPKEKKVFLQIKRAVPNAKWIDRGDAHVATDPATAQPIAEIPKGLAPEKTPEHATATETAKLDAASQAKRREESLQNERTLNVWRVSRKDLIAALEGTKTGPIAGQIPAVTASQQTAEGAIAAVAPVLKQLFRSAGEGIFTDRDQQLLLDMVPKRTDHPEARKAKMGMIDAIIEAKLGGTIDQGGADAPGGWTVEEVE